MTVVVRIGQSARKFELAPGRPYQVAAGSCQLSAADKLCCKCLPVVAKATVKVS